MSKSKIVFARITEEEYKQLMMIATAMTPAGEKVVASMPIRMAIRKFLESYGAE